MTFKQIGLTLFIAFFMINDGYSQALNSGGGESDRIDGRFKFIPIPFVDYDRLSGLTLGALPMMMFNLSENDTISPSSTVGLFAMYSENKSWFTLGFGSFFIDEDSWRVDVAAGFGDSNFQYYANNPINKWVRYNTNADFAFIGVQRKIIPHLYGGLNFIYSSFKTNSDYYTDTEAQEMYGFGFDAVFDKRSNVAYPRNGYYLEGEFTTYPKSINKGGGSNQMTFTYNHYLSMRDKTDVLAGRVFTGLGLGKVNFNQQFIVSDADIRGYSLGKFRGNSLIAAQGEYRWNFHKKFGAVGFAGLATVFGGNNNPYEGRILPGVGTGVRYVFMEKTHSTFGIDVAVGDGDWSLNFRLSEAF